MRELSFEINWACCQDYLVAVDGPAFHQQGDIRKLRLIKQTQHVCLLCWLLRLNELRWRWWWRISLVLVHQRQAQWIWGVWILALINTTSETLWFLVCLRLFTVVILRDTSLILLLGLRGGVRRNILLLLFFFLLGLAKHAVIVGRGLGRHDYSARLGNRRWVEKVQNDRLIQSFLVQIFVHDQYTTIRQEHHTLQVVTGSLGQFFRV